MATLKIKYCDIPMYLRAGAFYRNLSSDDPESVVEIPVEYFAWDASSNDNLQEFRKLLSIMSFWALDEIPQGVLDFCGKYRVDIWQNAILNHARAMELNILPTLLKVFNGTTPIYQIFQEKRWEVVADQIERLDKGSEATSIAAAAGNLRILRHLDKEGFLWHPDTSAAASKNGHLECLRYAYERSWTWQDNVVKYAALNGHLNCLKYAHENGCPWTDDVADAAAVGGHVDCLEYALQHGCPVDDVAVAFACKYGNMACVRLLHQHGVPWNNKTTFHAAQCANMEILQYLRENGCVWDRDTPQRAASNGIIDTLRYALEQGCPYHDTLTLAATMGNSLACFQYLVEDQLLELNEGVFMFALLRGDLPCLRYLLDQGCPYLNAESCSSAEQKAAFDEVFKKDNPEFVTCVEYAMERGWPVCHNFKCYLLDRDLTNCIQLFVANRWLSVNV